jgi:hypothetical protein
MIPYVWSKIKKPHVGVAFCLPDPEFDEPPDGVGLDEPDDVTNCIGNFFKHGCPPGFGLSGIILPKSEFGNQITD